VAGAHFDVVLTDDGPFKAPILESAPDLETVRDEDGAAVALVWTHGRDRVVQMPGIATYTCSPGSRRVTAVAEPDVPGLTVTEAFQKSVVPLLLYFAGHEVLHASAIQCEGGVVGFCAGAGTGKSTLAYGLSTRGFPLWADDALAVDTRAGVRAILLPFDSWLDTQSLTFFERSSPLSPAQLAQGEAAPLAALAVVNRAAGNTEAARIERLEGGRAFHEVVRHSYRVGLTTDRARRQDLVENYMKIVASLPVFEIAFRPGFERFPTVLDLIAEWLDAGFAQAA
jgi:hypothetical protein